MDCIYKRFDFGLNENKLTIFNIPGIIYIHVRTEQLDAFKIASLFTLEHTMSTQNVAGQGKVCDESTVLPHCLRFIKREPVNRRAR